MEVSCSNGFAPGDVVWWRRPCLVGDRKIQLTGVFPLFNATDMTLDCKNDLVSSQNAFSTKGSNIIQFFGKKVLANLATRFPVLLIQDVYPGSWIPDPNFFHPGSLIPDLNFFHPWCWNPDPNFSILTKKMGSQRSEIWSGFSIPALDPGYESWLFTYPGSRSWIPDL